MTTFAIVSRHAPVPDGTATGRILLGLCEGLQALGHDTTVWYWGPEPPHGELPSWCEWRPPAPEPWLRMKAWALVRPRCDVGRAGWRPPDGAFVLADDPISFPAVLGLPQPVFTMHYATGLDIRALGRRELRDSQDLRAERRFVRVAALAMAYSQRVSDYFGGRLVPVPVALPVPEVVTTVDAPVALMLANWDWPPNRAALRRLLDRWPRVRARVPHARLLVAGRGEVDGVAGDGVTVLGEVPRTADAFARAAVLAFPCPPTSGPKVKVLDAVASGLPVVTTPPGVEGLALPPDAVTVADGPSFADALADLLLDPERRQRQAAAARAAFLAAHSPVPAAAARLAALAPLLERSP